MVEQKEYAYGWVKQTALEDTFRVIPQKMFINVQFVQFILSTYINIPFSMLKVEVIKLFGITLIQNGDYKLQHWLRI